MQGLNFLNAFVHRNWSQELQNKELSECLLYIFLELRAVVDRMPQTRDYLWFNRRQRILCAASKALLDGLITT